MNSQQEIRSLLQAFQDGYTRREITYRIEPGINPLAQNMQALRAGQPRRGFQELRRGFNPADPPIQPRRADRRG